MPLLARVALIAALLVAPSCRPDELRLQYRFAPGAFLAYRLTARADAFWDVGAPGSGSYRVTFRVSERIVSTDDSGAVVAVTMQPEEVTENGLPSPGAEDRSFTLRVGPNGEVRQVIEVDGVPATALDHDELAFIGTYRPPLPLDPVERIDRALQTEGRLLGLRREDHRLAELGYEGSGPLTWETTLPQGDARLTGTTTTRGHALFDIDDGYLRSASSRTSGDFGVRVSPTTGNVPITGTLHLDLDLSLDQVATE
jgi:hypothetical protein